VAIVMGLDQHRAQIPADWLDTDSGEVSRARVAPTDRAGVRRFVECFGDCELEVALEATTGLAVRGRGVAARRGDAASGRAGGDSCAARDQEARQERSRGRAASTRAGDGRAAAGVVDCARAHPHLRARVRLRHLLVAQRGEWQQRIQAVLYHHGFPQRRNLMTDARRQWLAGQTLPATAREQIMVAIAMLDALDRQRAPIDKQLRSYARRQPGCRALMGQFGIGERSRSSPSSATRAACPPHATPSAMPGWTSPCISPTGAARRGI
jgi:transposase